MKRNVFFILIFLLGGLPVWGQDFSVSYPDSEDIFGTVRSKRYIFLGINGTIGAQFAVDFSEEEGGFGVPLKAGVDFAWPISDKFAIGCYFNIGSGPGIGLLDFLLDFKFGVLMLTGDLSKKPFIIGIAPCTGFGVAAIWGFYLPVEFRFGRVLGRHFYITGNINMGINLFGEGFMVEPSLSFGYHFGHKWKAKK